ncbi:hypothetical protein CBOM_07569 [Ceraceosorus bombacis]|uniref:Uncharacterized protein n=1 Tax=Ceraceosorus bombacis TaxID=401625 RepID=A0A0P1BFE9_9BASI|nr:hypothetical protein CBOM_07569 [Ceraceosorus bombacis]
MDWRQACAHGKFASNLALSTLPCVTLRSTAVSKSGPGKDKWISTSAESTLMTTTASPDHAQFNQYMRKVIFSRVRRKRSDLADSKAYDATASGDLHVRKASTEMSESVQSTVGVTRRGKGSNSSQCVR